MPVYDVKRELKALYAPRNTDWEVVDVPPIRCIGIDGAGDPNSDKFKMLANGHVIYEGKAYGGAPDPDFDRNFISPNPGAFHTATYDLPAHFFENGCLALDFSEPRVGVMLSEFWITKK